MRRNVWIMNHYAGGMLEQRGGRHYWLSRELMARGYAPVVFCANTLHNTGGRVDTGGEVYVQKQAPDGFPFVFVKTTPYAGNGLARVCNMLLFAHNLKRAARRYAKAHGRPDVIYASSVHPFTLAAGQALGKEFGVPCVCEIRDLWPESIVSYGVAGRRSPAVLWMYGLEKRLYARAHTLVFTMAGAGDYIREKGWDTAHGGPVDMDKVYYVNNGVDLRAFDENAAQYRLDDPDLDDPATFKAVYTGSIRRVNELGILLAAARLLRERPDIRILVYGEGDERESLMAQAAAERLENIRFKGAVDKTHVPYVLSQGDLNLLHSKSTPVLRYGISQNKLFEYLAAGKPVLATFEGGETLGAQGWGRALPRQTPEAIAAAVAAFADMPRAEYAAMCRCARETAGQYDFGVLCETVVKAIER